MGSSKAAEAGNINKFVIHANGGGKSIDISGGVATLMYYESILENCIKATVVIADTGYGDTKLNDKGILAGLPMRGGEKVYLKFIDGYGNTIALDNDTKALYVDKIRDKYTDGTKTIFTLDLCTKEYLYNEFVSTRVTSKYSGRISDTVGRILRDTLGTSKSIYTEQTLNEEVVFGNYMRPLELCTELATHSIPSEASGASGKLAGYFLFETKDGIYFQSIDKLLKPPSSSSDLYRYIYNSSGILPNNYSGLILAYEEHFYISLQEQLRKGTWGTETNILNILPEDDEPIATEEITASGSKGQQSAIGSGLKFPNLGEFKNAITRVTYSAKDLGINVPGSNVDEQLEKSREENYKTEDLIAQSKMRYNQLFTIKIDVTIAGNFALYAGRLIHCDFKPTSSSASATIDSRLSGIYMIADLCHLTTPKETFTKMTLVRESYSGSNP